MPMFTIEAPEGASPAAKQTMLREITEALDDAYHIQDIRGWLREYSGPNVSRNGLVGLEHARPVSVLEVPELAGPDEKRHLIQKIRSAIAAAYDGVASTGDIVVLINQYPSGSARAVS
jgi:phenylpyruvate tautomerase PptA (4-oxalocrotonate tautomerase family)